MNDTRIDWCDSTWNPVTGCLRGCDYCYARSIANRFGGWTTGGVKTTQNLFSDSPVLDAPLLLERKSGKVVKAPYPFAFTPTFHRYRLEEPLKNQRGQNIFVGSMADLFGRWVPTKWIVEVLDACRRAPQHNYLFLTKCPERYAELDHMALLPHEENFWYGATATNVDQMEWAADAIGNLPRSCNTFLSIEPLVEDITCSIGWLSSMIQSSVPYFKWLIIGAMTGPGSENHQPAREWVEKIVCDSEHTRSSEHKVKVFMKGNLRGVWGKDLIQEFPPELEVHK